MSVLGDGLDDVALLAKGFGTDVLQQRVRSARLGHEAFGAEGDDRVVVGLVEHGFS